PRILFAGGPRRGAEPGFADRPDGPGIAESLEQSHGWRMRIARELVHEAAGLRVRLLDGVAAELDQEPAATRRQQRDAVWIEALLLAVVHQARVDALQADRPVRRDAHHIVRTVRHIRIAEHEKRPHRGALDEPQA